MAYDRNFQPSIGNSSRIRVQVSTEYSPILPFIPLQPLTISSVSARTILVSVSIALTGEPQEFDFDGTSIPTDVPTDSIPSNGGGAKSLPACDVRHGIISTAPFGLVIFNYSPALTIHIADIDIWPPPSPAGQSINRLTLGGLPIWHGAIEIDSPTAFNSFIGEVSIGPRANKFLQVGFSRNYAPNGTEKIFITFDERECPLLDSVEQKPVAMKKLILFLPPEKKGQSLVEFAISLTVMLILLAGTVDFGIGLFHYIAMREAAQEGALYGSIAPPPYAGNFNCPNRNIAEICARVVNSSGGSGVIKKSTMPEWPSPLQSQTGPAKEKESP